MNPTVCTDHRRGDFSQQTPKATVTGRFTSAGTDPSVFLLFLFLVFVLLNDDDCRLGLGFHSGRYLKDKSETLPELIEFIRIHKIILSFLGSPGDIGVLANLDLVRLVGTLA
jgi:hypothetical protein